MRRMLGVLLLCLGLALPSAADTVGPTGPIAVLRVYSSNSDDFATQHGLIRVGDPIGGYLTYYWAGSRCPGLDLSDHEVELLQGAMNNPRVRIEPRYKIGQGGSPCLVSVSLVLRSDVGALP